MAEVHVVDDEPMICMLIAYVLRRLGHVAYSYRSAGEFFAKRHDHRPDLVIVDFIMPQVDGFEFCRRLRAQVEMSTVPVLLMTGLELDSSLVAALHETYGVVDILPKPFTAEKLIAISDGALNATVQLAATPDQRADELRERVASVVCAVGQRLQPRIDVRLPVVFSSGEEFLPGTTLNLSVGGMFIVAERAPESFSPVSVRIVASSAKVGLELKGTVAHVASRPDGTFGFGVTIRENNVNRFYSWYEMVARIVSASAGRHSDEEILVFGFEAGLLSPLQRLIALFCMVELKLTPVDSWKDAIARVTTAGHKVRLLMVNARSGSPEVVDTESMRVYQERHGGKIALLGLKPEARDALPPELDLACLHAPSMRELIDAIGKWLTLPVRATIRVPLAARARLTMANGARITCTIGDIGTGGFRLISQEPVVEKAPFGIAFDLPGFSKEFTATVAVRWIRSEGPERFVYGVAFEEIASETVAAIDGYIMTQWLS